MKDSTKFPSPIYQETVLAPIFDAFKANYYEEMMAINYAHLYVWIKVFMTAANKLLPDRRDRT